MRVLVLLSKPGKGLELRVAVENTLNFKLVLVGRNKAPIAQEARRRVSGSRDSWSTYATEYSTWSKTKSGVLPEKKRQIASWTWYRSAIDFRDSRMNTVSVSFVFNAPKKVNTHGAGNAVQYYVSAINRKQTKKGIGHRNNAQHCQGKVINS